MESNNNYPSVFVTIQLHSESNRLLSESCKRSNRQKTQEAALRLEDNLIDYCSISKLNQTTPNQSEAMEADHVCTAHS